jgi:two-component system, cell cycle sensor histidine kinase and response regulator CckA
MSASSPDFSANTPTILVADDDLKVLRLLEQTLRGAGYRVLLADGGWSAIQAFEESPEPVHLLLTDVIMPDLTGPVVAERLRAKRPDLPVLFISGFHDADLVQRFVSLKGFTLLPKPFSVSALLRTVKQSLDGVAA